MNIGKHKKQVFIVLLVLLLIPVYLLAQEKATVKSFDPDSRMATFSGKSFGEKTAKVSKDQAANQADLLKEGAKVMIEFEDRGGGDIRVKSIAPR